MLIVAKERHKDLASSHGVQHLIMCKVSSDATAFQHAHCSDCAGLAWCRNTILYRPKLTLVKASEQGDA